MYINAPDWKKKFKYGGVKDYFIWTKKQMLCLHERQKNYIYTLPEPQAFTSLRHNLDVKNDTINK